MRHLMLILLFVALLVSCEEDKNSTIFPENCEFKEGDVVLRRGSGIMSRVVIYADVNGKYSHVGIVVDSAGTKMIVHAVPDEPDYDGDADRVKMDTPEKFFACDRAEIGELRRHGNPVVARKAAEYAWRTYKRGVLFDHDYDDTDTLRMYCCEIVEAAYVSAGCSLLDGRRHDMSFPGMRLERCMLPSDFCETDKLRKIVSF